MIEATAVALGDIVPLCWRDPAAGAEYVAAGTLTAFGLALGQSPTCNAGYPCSGTPGAGTFPVTGAPHAIADVVMCGCGEGPPPQPHNALGSCGTESEVAAVMTIAHTCAPGEIVAPTKHPPPRRWAGYIGFLILNLVDARARAKNIHR